MAPTSSQVTTVAAGSALILGVIFTIYLIKRRNKVNQERPASARYEANTSQNALLNDGSSSENELLVEDTGPPLPDKEGMTVSSSWAILNNNSETSSPHLSPVESETEMDPNDDTTMSASQLEDKTENSTVLEAANSTALEQTGSSMLSTVRERETAVVDKVTLEYEELLREHQAGGDGQFSAAEIQEALMAAQTPAVGLTSRHAEVLVGLMTYDDLRLKHAAVQGIANCATFTNNQNILREKGYQTDLSKLFENILREKGCLTGLSKLLEVQRMALWLRHKNASSAITITLNAIINMSVNEENNKQMQACLPTLLDITVDKDTGEAVCLPSLQALTNLSVTGDHHSHYTQLVTRLYEFLREDSAPVRLQALKILVNLSCNPDMVPHLLAAKAPEGLLNFLKTSATEDAIILRFTTLLANILHVVKEKNLTASSLPASDKAASPETMYTAIFGISNIGEVKSKSFLLCRHSNEDIRHQAARVYNQLK